MILVTGGSGLVGQVLISKLESLKVPFLAPGRQEMDLLDEASIKKYLLTHQPDVVVHLAAETNVDLCEVNRTHAIMANLNSTKVIADYCSTQNKKMIFISTSGVLAGHPSLLCSEIDIPSPTNFYSLTKLRAEEYIRNACSNFLIIRASWMIGRTNGDNKKFAEKIAANILSGVAQVKAVFDLYGSVTSGSRLADLVCQNLQGQTADIIHCASKTICSRYDIAKHMKLYFSSPTEIIPVRSSEFPLSAPRGLSEGLSSEVAEMKFGYTALTWESELDEFLASFKSH